MFFDRFVELVASAENRLEPAEYRELINRIHQVSVDKGAERVSGVGLEGDKVLGLLQPMREVQNDLENFALGDAGASAKDLLDMSEKLTAVELAVMELYNRELIAEGDRLEQEREDLMDPARFAPKKISAVGPGKGNR
jgi:hypothetical protein